MTYPVGSFAVLSAVLLLQISPWRALLGQYHLPSSCPFLKPSKEEAGEMQRASCPPFLSSSGSRHVPDETALLWQILFLEEASFPGGSVAQLSGAVYAVSSLPYESMNCSEVPVWFASSCVAGNACNTLGWMCWEHDRVFSQAGQVSPHRQCRALLTLLLYFPKVLRCKMETSAFQH